MDDRWRDVFTGHAGTRGYRRAVTAALERTGVAVNWARRPCVAWSGGKDSTVLAHLARRIRPSIDVVIGTSGARSTSDLEDLGRLAEAQGIHLIRHGFPPAGPWGLRLVALREDESPRRKRLMRNGMAGIGRHQSWPIHDWSWLDVWAYIIEHEIPYHPVYDQLAAAGIGYDRSRFHWAFSHDPRAAAGLASDGVFRWRLRHQ